MTYNTKKLNYIHPYPFFKKNKYIYREVPLTVKRKKSKLQKGKLDYKYKVPQVHAFIQVLNNISTIIVGSPSNIDLIYVFE